MKTIVQNIQRYSLLALAFLLVQCRATRTSSLPEQAAIVKEGFFTCFEKGLTSNGKPLWCETSAIVFDGQKLLLASDKDMPGANSAVFYWPMANGFADTTQPAHYLVNPFLKKASKYEDFAITPDKQYIFLSTGFDRIQPSGTEFDGFNSLCYWPAEQESKVQVVSTNGTDSTSISVRNSITKLLANAQFPNGMPYFKLEGLAVTNDKIYWGVREEGKKYDDFTYKAKIISVSYTITDGRVTLKDDFAVVCDMNLNALAPELPNGMGLSSIEYDPYRNKFWILTSLETADNKLGAYLWTASLKDLQKNQMQLVKKADGKPLAFTNKAEDLCLLDQHTLLVIHDDDRVRTKVNGITRAENQAAYSMVQLGK